MALRLPVVRRHVLAIGSGLTALDVLVALDACGHRGVVHILSRHGRFPNVHADVAPYEVIPALDTRDARALLRSFRLHLKKAVQRGFDWRSVVDALRPEGEATRRRLSPVERRRSNSISARIGNAIAIALLNKLTGYANAIKKKTGSSCMPAPSAKCNAEPSRSPCATENVRKSVPIGSSTAAVSAARRRCSKTRCLRGCLPTV